MAILTIPSLGIAQVIMTKLDLFGPCEQCGDVLDEAWDSWCRASYLVLLQEGWAEFCSTACVVTCLKEKVRQLAWFKDEAPLDDPFRFHPTCSHCRSSDPARLYANAQVPWESPLEQEDSVDFCSHACFLAAFENEAKWQEQRGLGKWFMPVGSIILDAPREERRTVASLRRLRRKLRPRELARLGF